MPTSTFVVWLFAATPVQPDEGSKLNGMWVVIDFALDNGEIFRVTRPMDMDSAQPMTLAPELIELVTEGKLLLLEARDTDGHVRHALLSAPHISSASWQIVEHVPTPTDQVLWRPTGAPAD